MNTSVTPEMETSFVNEVPSQGLTLPRADKALVKHNVIRSDQKRHSQLFNSSDTSKNKLKKQPKGYGFWALVLALTIIALANLFLTITIFSVLSLTKSMKSVEVLPAANLIKFFGNFEIDKLIKADGIISGFSEDPIQITAQGSDINLKVENTLDSLSSPLLNIGQDSVEFLNVDSFDVYEPNRMPSKSNAFSTTFPNFDLPKGVQSLHIQKASVNRITSGLNHSLSIDGSSNSSVHLRGNEGLQLKSRELIFSADQNLSLRSINGSIILDAQDGVFLDVDRIALSPIKLKDQNMFMQTIAEYKLCICMPGGVLFRIPVLEGTDTIHCNSIDLAEENLCM